jgi:hypothetical protein
MSPIAALNTDLISEASGCQKAFGSPACFNTSFAVCRLFERGTMTIRFAA